LYFNSEICNRSIRIHLLPQSEIRNLHSFASAIRNLKSAFVHFIIPKSKLFEFLTRNTKPGTFNSSIPKSLNCFIQNLVFLYFNSEIRNRSIRIHLLPQSEIRNLHLFVSAIRNLKSAFVQSAIVQSAIVY
jgi:hypothetical protein